MKAKKKKPLAEEFIDDLLDLETEDDSKDVNEDSTPALEAEISNLFRAVEEEDRDQPAEDNESATSVNQPSAVTILHHETAENPPTREESVFDEVSKLFVENLHPNKKSEGAAVAAQNNEKVRQDSVVYLGGPQDPENTSIQVDDNTMKIGDVAEDEELSFATPAPTVSPQDRTVIANPDTSPYSRSGVNPAEESIDSQLDDRMRASVGRFAAIPGGLMHAPTTAALAQSENLRIAQARILELETEIERIRLENERLAAVGETFRKRADSLAVQVDASVEKSGRERENFSHEKEILARSLEAKTKEVEELHLRIDELETRLSSNIQKIRVRERELENRLELVKMESQALLRSKDEILLDLKRQLDQLNMELDNYRTKGQDLNRQLSDKQDMVRRTVKALRLALSMLEGEEESKPVKRAK